MPDRSVLFVGLSTSDLESIPLPPEIGRRCVESCAAALDAIADASPTLIVASQQIGGADSLDFFTEAIRSGLSMSVPIVFMSPPASGVQPFLYHRRRSGYEVRYLDTQGGAHTHFVDECPQEKDYVVKGINAERLPEEIAKLVIGDTAAAPEVDATAGVMELGFNQAIEVGVTKYHVQTEVVEALPLTVSTTVFAGGRTVFADNHKVKLKTSSLADIRAEVERLHLDAVRRLTQGALR